MITFFIQLVIPLALMFFRFNKRKHFAARVVLFGLLFAGLSALWYKPDVLPFLPSSVSYFLYYLTCYVFALLYVILCFDMPIFNLLFFAVVAFIVQNFSHHLFELKMRASGVPVSLEYGKIEYLLILAGIYAAVYSVFFFVFIRRLKPEDFMRLPKFSALAIALAFFLVMIILGVYVRHIKSDLLGEQIIGIGYELYSVILDLFIICMQFGVFNNGKLRENYEELERRLEHEGKYYEIAKANMEQINIKCHDLKHQISALRSMKDTDERQNSIAELEEAVMIYDNIAKTGNDALDYILTEKGMYCQQSGISFAVIADGKKLSAMRYNDIYALFGNALDNAIESVLKIGDKSKRIIGLKICERGGMLHVHLENYCETPPSFSGGLPQTTKTEDGHGFGIKSIRYIVQKYGGNLTIRAENNIFSLDILLPLND